MNDASSTEAAVTSSPSSPPEPGSTSRQQSQQQEMPNSSTNSTSSAARRHSKSSQAGDKRPRRVRRAVTVRVPATTANLGPGYDAVGMAVNLWNELTIEAASAFSIIIEGEGSDVLPRDDTNYVVQGVKLAFEAANKPVPPLAYICKNGIPFGSGLGSSSAAIISGLLAGLVMADKELAVHDHEEMLQLAARIEGHIDNLSPCIYGGMQLGIHTGERWHTTSIPVPEGMQCIIFTPSMPMNTNEARALLKPQISREDAVFNIGRAALLVHAFSSNNLDLLKLATQDRLHQPQRGRKDIMPALFPVVNAALAAGAKGAFLSGAGSSIMALTAGVRGDVHTQRRDERRDQQVADAMTAAAAAVDVKGRTFITQPSNVGAHVVSVVETTVQDASLNVGMRYRSTRDPDGLTLSFEEAVMTGLATDGGLFVPDHIPLVSPEQLQAWRGLSFVELATEVMTLYIGHHEIPRATLTALLTRSYSTFTSSHVTPLIEMSDDESLYLLEQFHGPTCAFKDVALQFVGNLFEYFLERKVADKQKIGDKEGDSAAARSGKICVLGATSGDTGSAAIAGLRGKEMVDVFILHPKDRVAPIQEAQMTTVLDENVHNVAVKGTFDDCQAMVKACFNDPDFRAKHNLAAVNSINWARILAQIVYYFYAYFRWVDYGRSGGEAKGRQVGDEVSFVVPTGNFGNALAGFYAREMGLPIDHIVVATNKNDILHRFISSGDYSSRLVEPSLAPAMDIVVPSNFERFLFWILEGDAEALKQCMHTAKETGELVLGSGHDDRMSKLRSIFLSMRADDDDIQGMINKYKQERHYVACPHTAAGLHAFNRLKDRLTSAIALATAHPAKFGNGMQETREMQPLVPPQLEGLLTQPRRCAQIPLDLDRLKQFIDEKMEQRGRDTVAGAETTTPLWLWSSQAKIGGVGLAFGFAAGALSALLLSRFVQRGR